MLSQYLIRKLRALLLKQEAKEVKEVKAPKETKAVKPAAKATNNTYPILNQELREAIKNPAIKIKIIAHQTLVQLILK